MSCINVLASDYLKDIYDQVAILTKTIVLYIILRKLVDFDRKNNVILYFHQSKYIYTRRNVHI